MQTDLPVDWGRPSIEEIADVFLSNVDKKSVPGEQPVRLCNYMDVYRNAKITRELNFMEATATERQVETFTLRRGDVLFTKDSETPTDIAIPSVVAEELQGPVLCGYHLAMLRPNEGVEGDYLVWSIRSASVNQQFVRSCNGSTRFGLTSSTIRAVKVPLPPLPEQRKIAEILGSVDEAIKATEGVIEQTRRVKEGLLQELLTKGRYPTVELGEVGHVQLGQQRHPKFTTGDNVRPYLRVANVLDGRIDFSDLNTMHFPKSELHKFELRDGDILLNEGQSVNLVGRSALYRGEVPGLCVQKTLLRYRCGDRLLPNFAQAVFQYWLWSGYFAEVSVQTTSMAHLTGVRFRRLPIPVPPLDEQQRLVAVVGSVEKAALLARRELDALGSLKQGLLQDLLTGKVRVKP